MKGKSLGLLAWLIAAMLLGACSQALPDAQSVQSEPGQGGKRTIITHFDTVDNFELTNQLVTLFNRQSKDTLVSVHYFANERYDDEIRRRLTSGEDLPDTMYLRQPGLVNEYAAKGVLKELTGFVASSKIDLANYGGTLEIISGDGRLFALPRIKGAWMLFYNKDLFDRAGIPYPGQLTWDEYADLALRLTSQGYPKVYGGHIPDWTMNLGATAANEYLTDDELPITRRYIQLLNRLYNVDKSHPDLAAIKATDGRPYEDFTRNRIAMMINGDWSIALLANDPKVSRAKLNWDIAPLPVFGDTDTSSTVGGCSYLAASVKSQHLTNAFEFIAYSCGEQGANVSASRIACPAYFTEESANIYLEAAKAPGARVFFESKVNNEEGSHPRYRDINVAFKSEMSRYLTGEVTLDQAFAAFYQERARILSGG